MAVVGCRSGPFAISPRPRTHRAVADVLLGDPSVRASIDRGDSLDEVVAAWEAELGAFRERRKAFLIYE